MLDAQKRQLVADNADLIYWFCHKRKLSIDEWYDILAIKLCDCAKQFDESKGQFSTYVIRAFNNEVIQVNTKGELGRRVKYGVLVVSSEQEVTRTDEPLKIVDLLESDIDVAKQVECSVMLDTYLEYVNRVFKERDAKIFKLFVTTDLTCREIGEQFGMKHSAVRQVICKIQKRLNEQFRKND